MTLVIYFEILKLVMDETVLMIRPELETKEAPSTWRLKTEVGNPIYGSQNDNTR
jgi:hypothetical protein